MNFIKGEIYIVKSGCGMGNLCMWGDEDSSHYIGGARDCYHTGIGMFRECDMVEAPYIDKLWLRECIRLGKFINFKKLKLGLYELY